MNTTDSQDENGLTEEQAVETKESNGVKDDHYCRPDLDVLPGDRPIDNMWDYQTRKEELRRW